MIQICSANTDEDLRGILSLQNENHFSNVTPEVALTQGFVTVKHDFETLKIISGEYRHVIAKDNDAVVGYTLVMLKEYGSQVRELVSMFKLLDSLSYKDATIGDQKYMVMGQVCVDKNYRGQNIFYALYEKLKEDMKKDFQFIITEIANRNTRSMRAHAKVGFETIHSYIDPDTNENWNVVLLKLES
jgi:ribosomal protein S18 acetylase RimI-like enzyme